MGMDTTLLLSAVVIGQALAILALVYVVVKDRAALVEQLGRAHDRVMAGTWEEFAKDRHSRNDAKLRALSGLQQ